jgi:hypothetical protein
VQNLRGSVDDYKYVGLGWYPANPEMFREGVAFLATQTFQIAKDLLWIACEGPKGPHRFRHILEWVTKERKHEPRKGN